MQIWKDKIYGFEDNSAARSSVWGPLNQGVRVPFAGDDAFRNTELKEEV